MAQSLPEKTDWRPIHVGLEDKLSHFAGVGVWTVEWRSTGEPPVDLPHPAYPAQRHRFDIYEAGNQFSQVRFAAAELSNGVWGFYLPATYTVAATGTSADGSLRFEQRLIESRDGSYPLKRTWALLHDAASGALIADCGLWDDGAVTVEAGGDLMLHLDVNGFGQAFRIDPATRTFADVLDAASRRPLTELGTAIERAHRADRAYLYRRISPAGSILVDLASSEWGNSHWVNSPRVTDLSGNRAGSRVVLDLWNTDWDTNVSFPAERRVHLGLRRYHAGGMCGVDLDLDADTYRMTEADDTSSGPLAEVIPAITRAAAASVGSATRPQVIEPGPFAAWRSALAILAVAALALGGIAFWQMQRPERHPPLTAMPTAFPTGLTR
jgi:hypothetical protein